MKHIARQFEIQWDKPEPFALEVQQVDRDDKPADIHAQERMQRQLKWAEANAEKITKGWRKG